MQQNVLRLQISMNAFMSIHFFQRGFQRIHNMNHFPFCQNPVFAFQKLSKIASTFIHIVIKHFITYNTLEKRRCFCLIIIHHLFSRCIHCSGFFTTKFLKSIYLHALQEIAILLVCFSKLF